MCFVATSFHAEAKVSCKMACRETQSLLKKNAAHCTKGWDATDVALCANFDDPRDGAKPKFGSRHIRQPFS